MAVTVGPAPQPRERSQLEAALHRSREQLATSLAELQRSLQRSVAPSAWVRRHLGPCLWAAFLTGALLGRRARAASGWKSKRRRLEWSG
jgi:hypothetical protein